MSLTPTTELEAVNIMLETIGEAPVSSLEVATSRVDVGRARAILREQLRSLLQRGWDFNTDRKYTLVADNDGTVQVPPNALMIDPTLRTDDLVERARKLWDRKNHTFTLSRNVDVDVVWFLDFDECPEAVRFYVTIRSARVFQRRELGDEGIEAFTEQDEFLALTSMREAHEFTRDHSMLNSPEIWRARRSGRLL